MRFKLALVEKGDYKDTSHYLVTETAIKQLQEGKNIVVIDKLINEAIGVLSLAPCCRHGYYPYCPNCPHGSEYISESEAEFLRVDGYCSTEWVCHLD